MRIIILLILIAIAVILTGCHQHKGDEHDSDSNINHEHSEDLIYFTQQQAGIARVTVEILSPDTFRQVIKTSGQVISGRGDEANISSTANGIVSYSKSSIATGSAVKAGESIVTI